MKLLLRNEKGWLKCISFLVWLFIFDYAGAQSDNALIPYLIREWQIHNNFNILLLKSIKEDYLKDVSASKGRNVGQQFIHMYNIRLEWLASFDSDLINGMSEIKNIDSININKLTSCFEKSGTAMESLFKNVLPLGKIKNFKSHPLNFMGYLISHESHHRGQIVLSLKQAGHPLSDKITYGLWNWDQE